jgi:hypothetical protein
MRIPIRQSLVIALLVGASITWTMVALRAQGQGVSTIQRGAAIAPVPLNLTGLNPALVHEGSYIVNAQGGCNDCHTVPSYAVGGDPFAGEPEQINSDCYLAGGAAFGPFVSRNITPRANGLPANRTLEQFKQLMREGTDFGASQETPILQVMPWPVYGKMSDHELEAIYEYLRAIPSIPNPRPAFCTAPPPPA